MKIALYIRLSNADEETGFTKIESESIQNQRNYINAFLDKDPIFSNGSRIEFVDDGFSGTTENRPNLIKMMEATKSGEIDVICVKDFSRFFRDYIEAGNYLECVFPFLGVRFISINDNYDSDNFKGTTGGMEMVMRNIVYSAYSKDLSLKISTAKKQKTKQGKFIGSHPPFGYKKDEFDKNKLVIDEISSKYVRRVFDLILEGKSTTEVAKILNQENIPTKGEYFKIRYKNSKKHSSMLNTISWNSKRVYEIIRARVYVGDMVGGHKKKVTYNSKQTIKHEPIIVENTHTGIVTREDFIKAGNMIKTNKTGKKRECDIYPLRKLVRCGHCKYMMERKLKNNEYIFHCKNGKSGAKTNCNINSMIKENELEKLVINIIKSHLCLIDENIFLDIKGKKEDISVKIKEKSNLINGYKKAKLRLYEKFVNEQISKEKYSLDKKNLEQKIAELEILTTSLQKIEDDKNNELDPFSFLNSNNLTCEIANIFIEEILVFDVKEIEIKLKYNDNFF